ncbi:hypothetical protein T265_10925 [Opisthorchis viverrini]|uniref:Uncharacterized protein n=1 Tax=Opisthorchis viverrini TaxID=6198 RepID=A0A074ZZF1_OPIVI|nr:hypothetical protein T265_10925 [Opisthorchis viverrini]KER20554.1 hypothetical protein T265_10925 [Opisthorchis viverrini]
MKLQNVCIQLPVYSPGEYVRVPVLPVRIFVTAPSAGCKPSTNWSDSNWRRDTPSSVGKARSNNCCRPLKNTVGSDPGAILAALNCLIASWRSAGVSNYAEAAGMDTDRGKSFKSADQKWPFIGASMSIEAMFGRNHAALFKQQFL